MGSGDERHGNTFLNGPQHAAMLRALFPQAVFIPHEQSIHAPVNLRSASLISEVDALVDSGATDNFISPAVIQHFGIPTRQLHRPRAIRNVDGTANKIGAVTHVADLTLKFKGTRTQTFYIVDLGEDHMLLGMPFLAATNPKIDWSEGTFKGKIEASTSDAHRKHLPQNAVNPSLMKGSLQESSYSTILTKYVNLEPESQTSVRRTTKATALAAEKADKTVRTWQEQVPIEYHRYGAVFSEKASQRFPGPRPWDHAIDLIKDAPELLNCKTYPLHEGQQELLDEFLREHLKKGYITANSKSPYASPFFFVTKRMAKHDQYRTTDGSTKSLSETHTRFPSSKTSFDSL
jgi:hypothetical protein